MKKIICLTIFCLTFASITIAQTNLVVNGGFEDGYSDEATLEISGWIKSGDNPEILKVEESEKVHEGTYRFTSWLDGPHNYSVSQVILDLDAGSKYTLTAWIRSNSTSMGNMNAKVGTQVLTCPIPRTDLEFAASYVEMLIKDIEIGEDGICEISFDIDCLEGGGKWINLDDVSFVKQESSAISDVNGSTDFQIFPNPTRGLTSFLMHGEQELQIQFFDLSGCLVYQSVKSSDKEILLDVNNFLASGVYIVKVMGQNTSLSQKLVVN